MGHIAVFLLLCPPGMWRPVSRRPVSKDTDPFRQYRALLTAAG